MKFIGYDKNGAFDHRLDEIEVIKQHVEVVYQYVKDHIEQEHFKYILPDIDSDVVTCTLAISVYEGPNGPFIVKLYFPLRGDEKGKLNLRNYFDERHFFEGELTNMFKEFNIDISYPNKVHYEEIRNWRQL